MANLQKLHQLVLEHLDSGEEILYSVFGCYKTTSLGSNTLRNGAFFATNMRLIFYGKRSFGFDMEIFPYQKISSVEFGKDLLGHKIRFCTSGNDIRITSIRVGDVTEFTRYVRFAIDQKNSPEIVQRDVPNQILQSTQIGTQDNQTKATLQSSAQQANTEDKVSVPLSQTTSSLKKVEESTERTGRDLTICGIAGFLTGFGVGAPLSIGSYLMWRKLGIKGGLRWIAWGVTGFFTVPIIISSLSSIGEKQPVSQQPKQQSISQATEKSASRPYQASPPTQTQLDTPAQISPTLERTPAQNLAVIDSVNGRGSNQTGAEAIYDTLLDQVSPKCSEPRSKIADMTVATLNEYQKLDKQGSNLRLLRELVTVQEGYEGTQDCAGLYTALLLLKKSGYQ